MIENNKKQFILSCLLILFPIIEGVLVWNYIPEQSISRLSFGQESAPLNNRVITVFVIPVALLIVHCLCLWGTSLDQRNRRFSRKAFDILLWVLPITSLAATGHSYAVAYDPEGKLLALLRVAIGLAVSAFGLYLPFCKKHQSIGIKVKWAIESSENWKMTHKFAGKLWLTCGIILLALVPLPIYLFLIVFFPIVLILWHAPVRYSRSYYKKQKHNAAD